MTPKKLITRFIFASFALWVLGFGVFSLGALRSPAIDDTQTADAIIALTGGAERIDNALSLFAHGRAENLFISGVHPDVKKHELLTRWKGKNTLPKCCITLGQDATTTIGNAKESSAWAAREGVSSIILVTSNYHMPRAFIELEAEMPDISIYLHPIRQHDLSLSSHKLWTLLFSEYHKFILRRVQLFFHCI